MTSPQTPEDVAARFSMPLGWAAAHIGSHICVDGRRYVGYCLVTDPGSDGLARYFMAGAAYRAERAQEMEDRVNDSMGI